MNSKQQFSPLSANEQDALAELANMAMGKAATSLRQLVNREVLLRVPSIEVLSEAEVVKLIGANTGTECVAVREDFRGVFSGRALLIFPEAASLELVRAAAGQDISLKELADLETEAIAETGNVVLNCWVSTFANVLKRSISMSVPKVVRGDVRTIFHGLPLKFVLLLRIEFAINETAVAGYLALVMDLPSMHALRAVVTEYIMSIERR